MNDENLDQISIDREFRFNNQQINEILHYLIDYTKPYYTDAGVELKPLVRFIKFCEYTSYVTDEKLLNGAINNIKNKDLLKNSDAEFKKLKQNLDNSYSDIDIIKLKAIFYSLDALFEIYIGELNPPNTPPPFPYAELKGRIVCHNLSSIIKTLRAKSNFELKESIKILTQDKTIELIDLRLESYTDLDYLHSTNIFTEDIEYLKNVKNKILEKTKTTSEQTNPVKETEQHLSGIKHENIFAKNGFKLFEYILNNHVSEKRGRINDISFYYRKMFDDKYIIQKIVPFLDWYCDLYDVETFKIQTINTVQNKSRNIHYSNSLNWFKLQNQ